MSLRSPRHTQTRMNHRTECATPISTDLLINTGTAPLLAFLIRQLSVLLPGATSASRRHGRRKRGTWLCSTRQDG